MALKKDQVLALKKDVLILKERYFHVKDLIIFKKMHCYFKDIFIHFMETPFINDESVTLGTCIFIVR